jgi:hypothetical protein
MPPILPSFKTSDRRVVETLSNFIYPISDQTKPKISYPTRITSRFKILIPGMATSLNRRRAEAMTARIIAGVICSYIVKIDARLNLRRGGWRSELDRGKILKLSETQLIDGGRI